MGIDFSHCEARWAYSGFHRFRTRLAEKVGLKDFETITSTKDKRFNAIKKDPIVYLLAHSDCDGYLTPTQCKKLAPRLSELVKDWTDDYDREQALELVKGMKSAAKKKQKLKFE